MQRISFGTIGTSIWIRYDEDVAHRADYDAEVLAQVFMHMLNELKAYTDLKRFTGNARMKLV